MDMDIEEMRKITGRNERESLAGLYSEDESNGRIAQPYLVLGRGGQKAKSSLQAPALQQVSTDLILLDLNARPFFSTKVTLLVPNNQAN
jgi:hypothetical protein